TSAHTIGAHDSAKITVRFVPTAEQLYSATLNVNTDEGASSTRPIALTGRGINSKLSVDQSLIDFGEIDTGTVVTKKFTITNNGSAAAHITAITRSGDASFAVGTETFPIDIAPTATKDISVTFSPKNAGTFDGSVMITASEGSPISVSLH